MAETAAAVLPLPVPASLVPAIELELAQEETARLLRAVGLAARRDGRARIVTAKRVWHDTPSGTLRGHGLAVSEQDGLWRLERLLPDNPADWPPAAPAPVLSEAASPALLGRRLTPAVVATLVPVAAFAGKRRIVPMQYKGEAAQLDILIGSLRGVATDQAACRIVLSGPPAAMAALVMALSAQVSFTIPRASLAGHALALVAGAPPGPRQLGAPQIPPGLTVSDALLLITAHLTDVILHWAARVQTNLPGQDAEPVHQMRVAVRRLRSALSIFRRAQSGAEAPALFRSLGSALKQLAATLGAARDWDVFLDGAGAAVEAAFPADKRVAAMLAAAARKRIAAYAALHAFLNGPAWRDLALRLALLPASRPWQTLAPLAPERDEFGELRPIEGHAGMLAAPAASYAAQALQRSLKRTAANGSDLSALSPDALHDARKHAKQLRYACEFFAPLFPAKPVRRFLERLEDVQETLGAVNDSHVAAALMAQLGTGPGSQFATGVVQGWVAATSAPDSRRAGKVWAKLLDQTPFWT